MESSRRDFVKALTAVVAANGFLKANAASEKEPTFDFPTAPRDRLAVTSYPFRELIDYPSNHSAGGQRRFEILDFPALMVEKFEIHNVNPLIEHFRSKDPSYLNRFRDALTKAHSHIVDLGLPGREFYSPEKEHREMAVTDGRRWIDMAVRVGSPSVRQHVHGSKGLPANVELASESLGELAEYGAKRNIVVNLENDAPVAEDPFFLVAVIEKVRNPYLRALPDFGNALMAHDAEFNRKGVKAMLGHAFNMCHVKDEVETPSGHRPSVDLKTMFELARASSYKGYFSMEAETKGMDPFAGTGRLVKETLQYLT
jgi:sugar phosphate isomerase/epimerase